MSGFQESNGEGSTKTTTILPQSGRILCCLCGVSIIPNAVAMCLNCVQQQPEFLAFPPEIDREITQCPKCNRWATGLHEHQHWQLHELESRGLLEACLKKISALRQEHNVKVLDVAWIWTEPHSRRLKFYVDTERLLMQQQMPVRQRIVCTYVVKSSQCQDCIVQNSDHTWNAQLQLRQSRGKEHITNIEQLLIKNQMGELMNDVQVVKDGLDLFFGSKQQMEKVIAFLIRSLPCLIRSKSNKLISRDAHTGVARTEHVVVLEVAPFVKNDLVLLTKPIASGLNAVGIVRRVTSTVQIAVFSPKSASGSSGKSKGRQSSSEESPITMFSLTADKFFKSPRSASVLLPAGQPRYLSRYIVLDVTPLGSVGALGAPSSESASLSTTSTGGRVAEVVMLSEDDMETQVTCITDLGHLLTSGDLVVGYDTTRFLRSASDSVLCETGTPESGSTADVPDNVPEVILVAKIFESGGDGEGRKKTSGGGGRKKRNRVAPWRRQPNGEDGSAVDTPSATAEGEDEGNETTAEGEDEGNENADEAADQWEDVDDDEDQEQEQETS